jgi:hypothetical protein
MMLLVMVKRRKLFVFLKVYYVYIFVLRRENKIRHIPLIGHSQE